MCFYINPIEYFKSSKDPVLEDLKVQLADIHPRFENLELYKGDKSYTMNKKKVYICVKYGNGRYYNRNMLYYVVLHEYAHLLCDEIGHTDKFFNIFDELLHKAAERGLYNPSIPPLDNYCGHD
jgi:hypothetical protein